MMIQFQCGNCKNRFEDKGRTFEYVSPVYGPCSKKVADCPSCGSESYEYRSPRQSKAKTELRDPGSCSMMKGGGCCCAGQG